MERSRSKYYIYINHYICVIIIYIFISQYCKSPCSVAYKETWQMTNNYIYIYPICMSHIFPIYFGGPCSWNRARLRSEDLSLALGPGSSSWGRRPRRQLATVSMGDVAAESESDNSEPDLGDLMGFHGI